MTIQQLTDRVFLFRALSTLLFGILLNFSTTAQTQINVKGVVVSDSMHSPLFGASISIEGTNRGTTTNAAGEFELKNVSPQAILIISSTGFNDVQVLASSVSAETPIILAASSGRMEEVVVTGFQRITKKRFTGAAASVGAKDVVIDGQVDVSRMLQGKVAGVSVQNVSGTFGSAPKIRIRGATSLSGDNKPLWVVDGIVLEDIVPISNDQLSSGDPTTLLGSSIAGLNANDIETFDILKDAAATALYGGRAMNGVIVITTKKGKAGATRINYTGNFTTAQKPNYANYSIMNSADQMMVLNEMFNKGFLNLSDVGNRSDWGVYGKMYKLINTYDATSGQFGLPNTPEARNAFLKRNALANTNWFDILFNDQFVQEHNIALTSGSERTQNFLSLSYYGDNGWTIADKVNRVTFNFNNNFNINKRLSTSLTARGSYRGQRAPGAYSRKSNPVNGQYDREFDINPFSYALNTNRAMTPYDENGKLEYYQRNYAPFNILHELKNNYIKLNVLDVQLQGELRYKLAKNFDYNFLGAVRMVTTDNQSIITENSNAAEAYRMMQNSIIANANRYTYKDPDNPDNEPVTVLPKGGFYNKAETMLKTYNIRNSISYNQRFGILHNVSAMVGQEIRSYDRQNYQAVGPGMQYDQGGTPFISYLYYKKTIEENNFPYSLSPTFERAASFYANATYSFDDKYNIDITGRYDGGNKLGKSPTARWLPTASAGVAWNIDRENFMKDIKPISYLKLRASYGLVGSLGNATNAAAVYRSGTTIRPYVAEKETYLGLSSLENSQLTWEKKNTFDIGLDGGLFDQRLRFVFDYYYGLSYDLIDVVQTSGIGGQFTKLANNANLKSHGIELSVNGTIINHKDFKWISGFNFGTNKSKITKTAAEPSIWDLIKPSGGNYLGYPVYSLFSIDFRKLDDFAGTPYFTNEDSDVSNNVYFQASKLYDKEGNQIPIDRILKYEGPVTPSLTGGFNNTLSYKNLSLNFFINFQTGNKIRLDPVLSNVYVDLDAFPKEFANRFIMPNDEVITSFPSIMDRLINARIGGTNLYNSYNYSTERVAKGDFVRLQTVSLQYNFPQHFVNRLGIQSLGLMGTVNNAWLIYSDKKLFGQDPEFFNTGGVAMPVSRQFTFSVKAGF